MDLRVIKTRKIIREAFLTLRKREPVEKIKVKDLCALALINKTTFYKYYPDVFALAEELENEAIEQFFSENRDIDCLFSAPERFIAGIPRSSDESIRPILELFAGREDVFMAKMEHYLLDYYKSRDGIGIDDEVLLRFIISGASRTMQEMAAGDEKSEALVADSLAGIIRKLTA